MSTNVQGRHFVFHDSDLAPLFHPLPALSLKKKHSFAMLMVSKNFVMVVVNLDFRNGAKKTGQSGHLSRSWGYLSI